MFTVTRALTRPHHRVGTPVSLQHLQQTRLHRIATSSMPPKIEARADRKANFGLANFSVTEIARKIGIALGLISERIVKKQMCIATWNTTGYVGNSDQQQLMPEELKNITLGNGEPLALSASDYFVDVFMFNEGEGSLRSNSERLYLPSSLFKDKKDGEIIHFTYKGQNLEVTLNQKAHPMRTQLLFEDVLKAVETYIGEYCDIEMPLFSVYNPSWWYTLEEGDAFYNLLMNRKKTIQFKEADKNRFHRLEKATQSHLQKVKNLEKVCFFFECPGMTCENINVIVNRHHLIVQGRALQCPIDARNVESFVISSNGRMLFVDKENLYRDMIACRRWDRSEEFKGCSLEQMKAIAATAEATLKNGILTIAMDIPVQNRTIVSSAE